MQRKGYGWLIVVYRIGLLIICCLLSWTAHAGGTGVFIVNNSENVAMDGMIDFFAGQVGHHYDQVKMYHPSSQEKRNDEIIDERTWLSEADRKRFKYLTHKMETDVLNEMPEWENEELRVFNRREIEQLEKRKAFRIKRMAALLRATLQESDVVDVMIFAHSNEYYEMLKGVEPQSLLSKIRLVYNSGCKDLSDADKYLKAGVKAYVGHPGTSCSPIFSSSFLKCWTGYLSPFEKKGKNLSECVKKGNDFLGLVLSGKAIAPDGIRRECVDQVTRDGQPFAVRLRNAYEYSRAEIRGDKNLSTEWHPSNDSMVEMCSIETATLDQKLDDAQIKMRQIFNSLSVPIVEMTPKRIPAEQIANLEVPKRSMRTFRFAGKLAPLRRLIAGIVDPTQSFKKGHSLDFQLNSEDFDPKEKAIEISKVLSQKRYRGVQSRAFIDELAAALKGVNR